MVKYAAKVQRETNKNIPFGILPSHVEKCEREGIQLSSNGAKLS
jgi:hypothetical protein